MPGPRQGVADQREGQDLISGEILSFPKVGPTLPTAPAGRVDRLLRPRPRGFLPLQATRIRFRHPGMSLAPELFKR